MQQHDFFAAAAGVAGTLIGLLFVAVSVARERFTEKGGTEAHRALGGAAFIAFINTLTVSLMALIPGNTAGWAAFVVSLLGLVFVGASCVALILDRRVGRRELTGLGYLALLTAVFVVELSCGVRLISDPGDQGALDTLSIIVVVCFLVGIARAWDLVGGPSVGLWHQLFVLMRPLKERRSDEQHD